ncbi:hypothetical protein K501DRAFT_334229 [Backusella circina FSU 941]|nr:hypothetical protein K501DRAFT_334229 [Backusella circina FSU 941]
MILIRLVLMIVLFIQVFNAKWKFETKTKRNNDKTSSIIITALLLAFEKVINDIKQNEFYIDLDEERNFYQGETIAGSIVIDLHKETRTSNIKVALIGTVIINDKPVVIYNDEALLARNPNGSDRTHILQAHTHRFRFSFSIPFSKTLPSTLNIRNAVAVKYRLIATHRIVNFRVLDLKKFSPTIYKPVNIFETINVESSEFGGTYSQTREVAIVGEHRKSNIVVKLPKRAAVKGDIIQINVDIDHIGTLVREKGVVAKLVQYVYSNISKSQLHEPSTLASVDKKIVISSPTDFSTSMNLKLNIPRNVSPTVEVKTGSVFRVEYLVQVEVNLNDQSPKSPGRRTDIVTFDVPFTIGTYPSLVQCIEEDDEDERVGEEEELDIISDSAISEQLSDTISSLSVGSNNAPQDGDDPKHQQYNLPISIQDAPKNYNRDHEIKPEETLSTPKNGYKDDDLQLPIQIQDLNNCQSSADVTTQSNLQPELPIQIPAQMSPSLGSVYLGPSRNSSIAGSIHRRSTQMSSSSTQVYLPMNPSQAESTPAQLPIMIPSPALHEKHNTTISHISRPNNPPVRINTMVSRVGSNKPVLSPIMPEDMSPSRPISQGGAFHWVPPATDPIQSPHIQPSLQPSFSDDTQRYSLNHYQRDDHPYSMNNHSYTNPTPMPAPMPFDNNNNSYPMSPTSPIPSHNNYPPRHLSNASIYPQRYPSNASNYPQRHPSNASNYPVHSQSSGWSNSSDYPVNSQPPVHFYMPEPNTGY